MPKIRCFPSFALGLLATFTLCATSLAKPDLRLLAESSANDRSAKKIRNDVAEEGLKTITTKEGPTSANTSDVLVVQGTSNEQLAVDHLESGPAILKPVIKVEPAPGLRQPANEQKKSESHNADPAKHHGHSSAESKSPAPDLVQKWLEHGNKRYVSNAVRTDGRKAADRKKLTSGQTPHAIVLSCSDSRVPPETVFDQALGEIFVVRTAGESLDSAVIASIEYAVEHLGPKLIVVMGHTSCGAVNAALTTSLNETAGSAALDQMIAEIRPRIPGGVDRAPSSSSSHALEIESAANAQGVASELTKRSEIIRTRVLNGQLKIKPALYYLDSGLVKFY
ncbi:MAG: carbonic anhydrase [Bdellovibrionales bacterium]|nr:carbonic anhydrase [Bdellovibrionales bacterium]